MRKKGSREITHVRESCFDALGWCGNKRYTSEISQGHLLIINGRERRLQVGFFSSSFFVNAVGEETRE